MASRAAVQSETSLTVQFLLKVVAASSVGQSNFNTFFRIFGTLGGAAVALVAYHLTGSHPTLLAIFGFFFSLPNFWLIVARPRWATTGRFVLLSMSCYS